VASAGGVPGAGRARGRDPGASTARPAGRGPQGATELGSLELRGLRLLGTVGVLPEEADRAQPLEVDLEVELDVAGAARHDELGATVDYGALCATAARVVEHRRFALLEGLAAALADAVLEEPRVLAVTVAVRKLRPPVPFDLAWAGVRLTRRREREEGGTAPGGGVSRGGRGTTKEGP
jgi:dihydroneopterin aldolase